MKKIVCSGKELDLLLSDISKNKQNWEIKRSENKNHETSISNLILCGRITNSTVGTAISKNISHIISISRFKSRDLQFMVDDVLEILYKNDIFVISLGDEWLFRTSLGKKMITVLLNNTNSSIWSTNIGTENIFVGFNSNLQLTALFARLRNCVYYFPAKLEETVTSISTILIIKSSFETTRLHDLPDLVLTMELTPSLITYCYHKKIILVFVHSDVFYFEIARDLSRLLMTSLKVPTTLCSGLNYKIKVK